MTKPPLQKVTPKMRKLLTYVSWDKEKNSIEVSDPHSDFHPSHDELQNILV